jgi:hypothetical protein
MYKTKYGVDGNKRVHEGKVRRDTFVSSFYVMVFNDKLVQGNKVQRFQTSIQISSEETNASIKYFYDDIGNGFQSSCRDVFP